MWLSSSKYRVKDKAGVANIAVQSLCNMEGITRFLKTWTRIGQRLMVYPAHSITFMQRLDLKKGSLSYWDEQQISIQCVYGRSLPFPFSLDNGESKFILLDPKLLVKLHPDDLKMLIEGKYCLKVSGSKSRLYCRVLQLSMTRQRGRRWRSRSWTYHIHEIIGSLWKLCTWLTLIKKLQWQENHRLESTWNFISSIVTLDSWMGELTTILPNSVHWVGGDLK